MLLEFEREKLVDISDASSPQKGQETAFREGGNLKPSGGSSDSIASEGVSGRAPRGWRVSGGLFNDRGGGHRGIGADIDLRLRHFTVGKKKSEPLTRVAEALYREKAKRARVKVSLPKDLKTMLIEAKDDQMLGVKDVLPLRVVDRRVDVILSSNTKNWYVVS
ncbi:hypothetical protein ACLOJK_030584 [Asimina triloba]